MAKCDKCNDRTFVPDEREYKDDNGIVYKEIIWIPCECRKERDKENVLRKGLEVSEIPKKYLKHSIDSYLSIQGFTKSIYASNKTKIEVLKEFMEKPSDFTDNYSVLWIYGYEPNSGHTTLACIFGKALIKSGYKVRFLPMEKLIDSFTRFDIKDEFFTKLDEFDVYIIDDAFDPSRATIRTDYILTHLFNFINNAINEDKHFIMTSNKSLDSMSVLNPEFKQCEIIISRSVKSLKFEGTING